MTKPRLFLIVLLFAVLGAYANSFHNGFHFDDFHTITDNPAVRSLHNLPHFFTDTTAFSVLPANRTYRPVVTASLTLDYALGHGYNVVWFHLSTFLLFLLLIVLLYFFYRALLHAIQPAGANAWLALFGAAWFGLHPAISETVNYIIQRGDLYCTLGCVAALVVYIGRPEWRRTGLYLLPLVFALLSKPPAAVFPLLLMGYIYFFEAKTQRLLKAAIAALPSIATTAALMLLQSVMTPKSFAPSILPGWEYRLTQPYVWLRYFGSLFLPVHLNVDTDLSAISTLNLQAVAGLLFLGAMAVCIWITARRRTLYPIAYGLLWFVVTQLPTSLYPLSEVENDHRMFFSFPGLILAVVWGAAMLWERFVPASWRLRVRPEIFAVSVLLLCGYAYGTHVRNTVWHDEDSLWLDDTIKCPHNGRGLMIYGLSQMSKGNYTVALDYFDRALQYTPNYPTLEINLGVVNGALADQGDVSRLAEAERHFQRAISLTPADDSTHAFYGRWLIAQGRLEEAITQLKEAVSLNPQRTLQRDLLIEAYNHAGDTEAAKQAATATLSVAPDDAAAQQQQTHPAVPDASYWINLSLAQYRQQRYQASIDSANRALQIDPKSAQAYNNIGAGYAGLQQWDKAIDSERKALALDPGLQIAQNNLTAYQQHGPGTATAKTAADYLNDSLALSQAGQFQQSIAAAQKALALDPHMAPAWNNIAAGYESLRRWDEAIAAAQKALALDPNFQLAKNNLAWATSQKKAGVR